MGTFSALAKRYHVYMIGSADVAPFRQSRSLADRVVPSPIRIYSRGRRRCTSRPRRTSTTRCSCGGRATCAIAVPTSCATWSRRTGRCPLTSLETGARPHARPVAQGRAAVANLRPYALPGTHARIGFATSLPAFTFGTRRRPGVNPCSDTALYYMRCLNKVGRQPRDPGRGEPRPAGRAPTATGSSSGSRCPGWARPTARVSDPGVDFDYNVTAMMVGNLADLAFDGQSAITQRGLRGRGGGCHYIGNASFVASEDQPYFAPTPARGQVPRAGAVGRRRPLAGCPARVGAALAPGRGAGWRTTTSRPRSSPTCRFRLTRSAAAAPARDSARAPGGP